MLSRFSDWPARLEVFLASARFRKFRYGQFDCALFVADAIEAMTGRDIAASFRGCYRSRSQARQAALQLACGSSVQSIAERVTAAQGMREASPILCARRGDLALIRRARDYSLALVAMNGTELLIALRVGFGAIPLVRATRVWRV